jgi:NAD+ synthase (glutamine-hydrolysing)
MNHLHAITMPGPGTSTGTFSNAEDLAATVGAKFLQVPIHAAVEQHLADLRHDGDFDVVFENAQARERTQILFNYANKESGIVVGTGDLSELALGWCTFNADHMANYNVNASVPKTLIAYLVRWYAQHRASAQPELADVLNRVLDTPISPELIPPQDDEISQLTESLVGPYELHDFFLFHFLRHGSRPKKIFDLAQRSFAGVYNDQEISHWLRQFFQRFISQQFKRSTLPPGPKVGSVSLSPRGDWRMPDEATAKAWLDEIDQIQPKETSV